MLNYFKKNYENSIINKKNTKNTKNTKKDYDNLLRLYQSDLAHQEMVLKAGGGLENLIDNIDNKNKEIELMKQKILSLMRENILMEKQLLNLTTTYKFRFTGIYLEINKERIKDTFKNRLIYKKSKIFINNLINIKNKINIKNTINLFILPFVLPFTLTFYFLKKNIQILYSFRYFIYFLNLLFLLNSIRQ